MHLLRQCLHERFCAAGIASDRITCTPETYVFRHGGAARELVNAFRDFYGPTMNAFSAATETGRADELCAELIMLFETQNQGGVDSTVIPATFLKVVVQKD